MQPVAASRVVPQSATRVRGFLVGLPQFKTRRFVQACGLKSAAFVAGLFLTASPRISSAHGGATGVQDVVQDYGLLAFLIAVILIGAGVLVWVMLAPTPPDTDVADVALDDGVAKKSDPPHVSELDETRRVDHKDSGSP